MLDFIGQPWPWYVAGPLIALTMGLLLYFDKSFGVSANLRTMCAMSGAGNSCDFFQFDWRAQKWNLVFVLGALIGGFVSQQFLYQATSEPHVSEKTLTALAEIGLAAPDNPFIPTEIIGWEALFTFKGILTMALGGFLVGFGSRYAGGCTSGHAISGLSELQVPSLIAVTGFMIGGFAMTHLLMPLIF